jgi:hypothetical protein
MYLLLTFVNGTPCMLPIFMKIPGHEADHTPQFFAKVKYANMPLWSGAQLKHLCQLEIMHTQNKNVVTGKMKEKFRASLILFLNQFLSMFNPH